ncbi:MAG: 3-methyl-2-oxobutanoate hydroxymethyltransferase [Proteobacteria bacterium]|nr:3-methyl-2-oxobutanoate hydroxymethyltransferase [Burkholderiales bacterium]
MTYGNAADTPRLARITLHTLQKMAQAGDRITMLTSYDASFTALLERAGVETLLIGDSLGMVIQGRDSTLAVSLRDMIYHTECVARGSQRAFLIADMSFGSFQISPQQAFENAAQLMAAGAQMVKIEGGVAMVDTVRFLVERGVPVCAHIGLTPQSVHQLGGYRVQGRTDDAAARLKLDAQRLEDAGAGILLFEAIPAALAGALTTAASVPTIGIGAGPHCSGQVLVLHDMLDVFPGRKARFVKNFMEGNAGIEAAVAAYVREVKAGTFPGTEHSF